MTGNLTNFRPNYISPELGTNKSKAWLTYNPSIPLRSNRFGRHVLSHDLKGDFSILLARKVDKMLKNCMKIGSVEVKCRVLRFLAFSQDFCSNLSIYVFTFVLATYQVGCAIRANVSLEI